MDDTAIVFANFYRTTWFSMGLVSLYTFFILAPSYLVKFASNLVLGTAIYLALRLGMPAWSTVESRTMSIFHHPTTLADERLLCMMSKAMDPANQVTAALSASYWAPSRTSKCDTFFTRVLL